MTSPSHLFPSSLRRRFQWLSLNRVQRRPRQLRLVETLALGDRRFVALVEAGRRQFLVGGTTHSLTLLSELETDRIPDFPMMNHPFNSTEVN